MIKYEQVSEDYKVFLTYNLPLQRLLEKNTYSLYDRTFNNLFEAIYAGSFKFKNKIHYRFNILDDRGVRLPIDKEKATYKDIWFIRERL